MDIFEMSAKRYEAFSYVRPNTTKDPTKVAVAFSGGIDSVYLLDALLKNPELYLFTFYYMRNDGDLQKLDQIHHLIELLRRKNRSFNFFPLHSPNYTGRAHVYVPRYVQMYQDLVPMLYAGGFSKLYVGWSLDDTDYVDGDFTTSPWWVDAIEFFEHSYVLNPNYWEVRKFWDQFGGGVAWRKDFVAGIADTYQKFYGLDWSPDFEFTPDPLQVTREDQYNVLDTELIKSLIVECGHTLAESRELQYFCPCHLHHYTLHRLGIR